MRKRMSCSLLALLFVLYGFSVPAAFSAGDGEMVSMINLIATPEKYDKKMVILEGFLVLEFEGDAIYLSEEDAKHAISKNGIWLSLDSKNENKILEYYKHNKSYVLVEGIFDAEMLGHGALFSGTLKDISRIGETPTRNTQKMSAKELEMIEKKLKENKANRK
jgi:hypothetical protein